MVSQSLRVWQLCPILGGTIKGSQGLPRSENLMSPRLKINFISYASTPESLVLFQKLHNSVFF